MNWIYLNTFKFERNSIQVKRKEKKSNFESQWKTKNKNKKRKNKNQKQKQQKFFTIILNLNLTFFFSRNLGKNQNGRTYIAAIKRKRIPRKGISRKSFFNSSPMEIYVIWRLVFQCCGVSLFLVHVCLFLFIHVFLKKNFKT